MFKGGIEAMNTRVIELETDDWEVITDEVMDAYPFKMKEDGSEITDEEALEIIQPILDDIEYKLLSFGIARYQYLKFTTYEYREEVRERHERQFSLEINHKRY